MQRTISVRGRADPATAWARYRSTARWPGWAPQIRAVDPPEADLRVGLRGTVFGPLGLRVPFVVDAVDDDDRSWSWTVHVAPITVRMRHVVRPTPTGSRTALTVTGPWAVCVTYPLVARCALRRLVAPGPPGALTT